MIVRIFLSWCHQDRRLTRLLLTDLLPTLRLFGDLDVEWWEDNRLSCGEDLPEAIVERIDRADFGLLLLSTRYFSRPFIQHYELPRFVGPDADRGALPVALTPLPEFGPELDLAGIERRVVFTDDGRSYYETRGARRTRFANDLAASVRRRALSLDGYRAL